MFRLVLTTTTLETENVGGMLCSGSKLLFQANCFIWSLFALCQYKNLMSAISRHVICCVWKEKAIKINMFRTGLTLFLKKLLKVLNSMESQYTQYWQHSRKNKPSKITLEVLYKCNWEWASERERARERELFNSQ